MFVFAQRQQARHDALLGRSVELERDDLSEDVARSTDSADEASEASTSSMALLGIGSDTDTDSDDDVDAPTNADDQLRVLTTV